MTTQTLFRPDSTESEAGSAPPLAQTQPVGHPTTLLTLRLLSAVALAGSAYIHLFLAIENGLGGTPFTLSQMFLMQATAVAVAAGLLLVRDRELFWLVAVGVAVGSAVPLLASVYFPLPAIGPFPPINEPIWYGEKLLSLAFAVTVPLLWTIRRIAPPQQ